MILQKNVMARYGYPGPLNKMLLANLSGASPAGHCMHDHTQFDMPKTREAGFASSILIIASYKHHYLHVAERKHIEKLASMTK